jgi:hypothetical protein
MACAPFPPWIDLLFRGALLGALGAAIGIPIVLMALARSPLTTGQRLVVEQPVEFDHRHHVRDDGIDCRYCHENAERSNYAGVPPTSRCMDCHAQVWTRAALLEPVRRSAALALPIRWRRVHRLPDFVYFDHAAHTARGVGCASCHGRVDQMAKVAQQAPLTMAWCLDCHRHPEAALRPRERITDMEWAPDADAQRRIGTALVRQLGIAPPTDCSGCHR